MGVTISINQDEVLTGGWVFEVQYLEKDTDGSIISDETASAFIDSAGGLSSTDLFLNGARLALQELERKTA